MARSLVATTLGILCLSCAPFAASAHEAPSDAAEHIAEDSVTHTAPQEASLQRQTASATRADAALAAAAVAGDEHLVGQWGEVQEWPVVGVHVALLPNGKVLAYDSVGDRATETYPVHDFTRATVWDPATGTHTPVNVDTGHNIFCSGLAHLADGSLFMAGGNKDSSLNGIRLTHRFNPSTNSWTLGQDMRYERWYPSVTPLSNGEMLITEGGPDIPEVRQTNGVLRELGGAALNLPLYPWIDVAPDGRAFYSGPTERMRSLNPAGSGSWQTYGLRGDGVDRDYGSHAVYDIGKTLVAGGGRPPTETARIIDLNGAAPQVSATGSMAKKRRQHNLTVLADGSVLATGGLSSNAGLVDLANGVYEAERWNPVTGQWTTMAAMEVTRQYHSTALLLPDGRVLSSGGGICGDCDAGRYLAKNAQVFTPPYLFSGPGQLAPRPTIDSAPGVVGYGGPLQISTPNAASISKVALVRLGAVTHSVDMEQRYVPLSFTRGSGTLTATGPANANIAPPGPYMLFVIDAAGVPSVARMVTVGATNPPPTVRLDYKHPVPGSRVPVTEPVVAVFSEDMDRASAEAAFSLTGPGGAAVAGTFAWYGPRVLIFVPAQPLAQEATYSARVSTAARDRFGNPLAETTSWSFTTMDRPVVDGIHPANGATGVPSTDPVVALFSEPMNPQSSGISLRTATGTQVPGSNVWWGPRTAIFLPAAGLQPNQRYEASISGQARDQEGDPIAAPVRWTFTTAGPGAAAAAQALTLDAPPPDDQAGLAAPVRRALSSELPQSRNVRSVQRRLRQAGLRGLRAQALAKETASKRR